MSSPLIISLDLTLPYIAQVAPIITNPEAIAVNQQWEGHPGMLLSSVDPNDPHPDNSTYVQQPGALLGSTPYGTAASIRVANMSIPDATHWCDMSPQCTCFTAHTANNTIPGSKIHQVYFKNNIANNGDAQWTNWVKRTDYPAQIGAQQVWAKPQPGGAWAIFLLNSNNSTAMHSKIPLSALNISSSIEHTADHSSSSSSSYSAGAGTGAVTVRDIWARKTLPSSPAIISQGMFTPPAIPPYDSAFYLLTPA